MGLFHKKAAQRLDPSGLALHYTSAMSNPIENIIEKIGTGAVAAEHFLLNVFNDVKKVDDAINSLPPDTKQVFAKIFTDLAAAVSAAGPAAAASGLNLALDSAAVVAIQKLITDAKEGTKAAEVFFTTLGIKL